MRWHGWRFATICTVRRALTLKILEGSEPDESAAEKIEEWSSRIPRGSRVSMTLDDINESARLDRRRCRSPDSCGV